MDGALDLAFTQERVDRLANIVRGEPIVCTPEDAYRCFTRTNMDYLVLGSYLIDKKEQDLPPVDTSWQQEFELD